MSKRIFLDDGTEAELVSTLESGSHLVRPVILYADEFNENWEPAEQIVEVQRIHDKPPIKKYSDEIEQARTTLANVKAQVAEVARTLKDTQTKHADILKRAEADGAIKYVFDFLDGKITHFISKEYSNYKILTLEEALTDNGDYRKELRLLTLSGGTHHSGGVVWQMNRYRDGSGADHRVLPFRSRDEALVEMERMLLDESAELMAKWQTYQADTIYASAKAYGIELPQEFVDLRRNQKTKERQKRIEELRSEIAKVESETTI